MTEKSDIRKEVRRRISSLSPRQRLEAANIVFDRIEHSEAFARATCVAFYASLPDEVPTHETIQRWAAAKRVVLPRVEGDTMRFSTTILRRCVAAASASTSPRLRANALRMR